MAFLRVNSCCCGCSLETGTKILAILGIIGGVLGMFGGIYEAATVPSELKLAAVFKVIGNIASIIISGFLLQATNTRKPVYCLPWLVVQGIGLVCLCIGLPIYACFAIYVAAAGGGDGQVIGILIGTLIIIALALCLGIYFYAVVFSFYHELKAEADGMTGGFNQFHTKGDAEHGYAVQTPYKQ